MRVCRWFSKGWEAGLKPGRWFFSRAISGRIAGFAYWLRKKGRREVPKIAWLSQEEVDRMAGRVRPKPRVLYDK